MRSRSWPPEAATPRPPIPGAITGLDVCPPPSVQSAAAMPATANGLDATPARPGDIVVIRVDAVLDRAGLARLDERCRAEMAAGADAVVLDFTGTTDCCSAVFVTLQQITTTLRASAASLHLVGFEAALRRVMEGAG